MPSVINESERVFSGSPEKQQHLDEGKYWYVYAMPDMIYPHVSSTVKWSPLDLFKLNLTAINLGLQWRPLSNRFLLDITDV